MRTRIPFITYCFISLICLCTFSCDKKSEQLTCIPNNANVIVKINLRSLAEKGKDINSPYVEIIKNAGIDFSTNGYFFGQMNEERKGFGAVTFALSDVVQFENFVKDLGKNYQITNEANLKIASNPESTIGWNANTAIVMFQQEGISDPTKTMASFFNLKKEQTVQEADGRLKDILHETADLSLWLNLEKLGRYASSYFPLGTQVDLKETFLTATINFEQGKINVDTRYHSNPSVSEKTSFTKGSVSKDVANAIPARSLVALIGLSLDIDKLYAYLQEQNMIANMEEISKLTTGYSSKEIFQMFSGEIAASLNGVQIKEVAGYDLLTDKEVIRNVPTPEYAIVVGIDQKEKASGLLLKLSELGMLQRSGNYYSYGKGVYLLDKGSHFLITGSETVRESAAGGKTVKINDDLAAMLTDNAGAFFLNIKDLPQDALDLLGEKAKSYVLQSQVETVRLTGTSLRNNVSTGNIEIAFKEKEENSLVTAARAFQKFSTEESLNQPDMKVQEYPVEGLDSLEKKVLP